MEADWDVWEYTKPAKSNGRHGYRLLGQVEADHEPGAMTRAAALWPTLASAAHGYPNGRIIARRAGDHSGMPGFAPHVSGPDVARYPHKDLVCFSSSFVYESAPNVTHMTLDGMRTACGRKAWLTSEGWHSNGPDCLRCRAAWARLPDSERRSPWDE